MTLKASDLNAPDVVIPTIKGIDAEMGEDGLSVRYHPDPAIDSSLRQALADFDAIDDTKRVRILAHVDGGGAQIVTVLKIAKGWSMATIIRKGWTDPRAAYGVQVKVEL